MSGHLLENSCLLGGAYALFVFCLLVILVISVMVLSTGIWVRIASVPGLCILFTFTIIFISGMDWTKRIA